MVTKHCKSERPSQKETQPRKKCETFLSKNIFLILENEESKTENNLDEDVEISPKQSKKKIIYKEKKKKIEKKKREKKKREKKKEKERISAIKKNEKELKIIRDELPILRCYNCKKSHFPLKKFCNWTIARELRNTMLEELRPEPILLDEETMGVIIYSIKYLEMKTAHITCTSTCDESVKAHSSEDISGKIRLQGGYGDESNTSSVLVTRAIQSGKKHGISLVEGKLNAADGNCAFDAVLNNINERQCFPDKLLLSSVIYRQIWVTELEMESSKYPRLGAGYSNEEREEHWNHLKQSGVYEVDFFGDLVIHSIAKGCNKNILIFNTSVEAADPI